MDIRKEFGLVEEFLKGIPIFGGTIDDLKLIHSKVGLLQKQLFEK